MPSVEAYMIAGATVFLLIFAVLSYISWKQTNTMADFAIADATLGPYILGLAFAGTSTSTAVFVGYVGWAYEFGYSMLWIFLALISVMPIALILFARRVRESNVDLETVSLPDWLGAYYDSQFMRVGVALAILFNLFYIAAQLSAGALIFENLLGWEYETSLAVITGIVTIYVLVGGTYADIYTDAIQAVVMVIMGVTIFVSPLWVFDVSVLQTPAAVTSRLAAQDMNLISPINPESLIFYSGTSIFMIFVLIFALAAQPQLFNKVLALNDPKNLRKMIITYIVTVFGFFLVIFSGFYMRALNPTLQNADKAIFVYIGNYFPTIITAFFGLVILMAAFSTTDGLYITVSTAVANDIFLEFIVKEEYIKIDENTANKISKYLAQSVVALTGIVSYLLVRTQPDYIATLVWVGIAGVIAASVAPIMLGIYFPGFVTRKGAIASVISGVVGYSVFTTFLDLPNVFFEGALSLFLSISIMTIVCFITDQEEDVATRTIATEEGHPIDD